MIDASALAKEITDRMAFGLDVHQIATELADKYEITLKKKPTSMASFCAMTCAESGFHKFLGENFSHYASGAEYNTNLATVFVKDFCGVSSRTELNAKGPEQEAWLRLQAQYQDWLRT